MSARKRANGNSEEYGTERPDIGLYAESDLNRRIEELAYYKAEARGFELGHELDGWIEAERELSSSA